MQYSLLCLYVKNVSKHIMYNTVVDFLLGAVALAVGLILLGTMLNYIIFIGHYRGQPIQQPIKRM